MAGITGKHRLDTPEMNDRGTIVTSSLLGLICAFQLRPGSRPRPLSDGEVTAALTEAGSSVWLHLNLADARARALVAQLPQLPAKAREILVGTDAHVRIDSSDSLIAGVLPDFNLDPVADPDSLDEFRLAMMPRLVVTVRRHPLRSLDQLRRELEVGVDVADAPALLHQLLGVFAGQLRSVVQTHSDTIDELEDRVLVGRTEDVGDQLGPLRRMLVRLRRRLLAERQALQLMMARLPEWIDRASAGRLREAIDAIDPIAQDLELVADRARLLQEELAGRIAEATSRDLFFLSIVTAIILPVTLITGIFGMNVGGLPWVGDDSGFFWVMALMLLTVLVTIIFLRRRHLF